MANESARELLNKALKRREELRAEFEALDDFIETYEKLIRDSLPDSESADDQLDLYRGNSRRAAQARVAAMVDVARRIIISEQRPMRRGELVNRLQQQGYEFTGGDKNKVFGTNLWRSGRFITVEGKGYWPNDVELPQNSST